jgi:hypothetical protein
VKSPVEGKRKNVLKNIKRKENPTAKDVLNFNLYPPLKFCASGKGF